MTTRRQSLWEFSEARDWITAIDEIAAGPIFVGTRDGHLYALNRYGARIGHRPYDNWVGALRAVTPLDPGSQGARILWVGTKSGEVECLSLEQASDETVRFRRLFHFKANNTIREIDATTDPVTRDTWIAIGSEDRHVYRVNLADVEENGDAAEIRSVRVNGWIRSVSFATDPESGVPVVAAGCGDKNVYFLGDADFAAIDPGKPRSDLRRAFVNAKVHSIVADPGSSTIFCASDARRISVVGWTGVDYDVVAEIDLPHRATKLVFSDRSCGTILAACEDGNVYFYDVGRNELVGFLPADERMFAIAAGSDANSHVVMLGHGSGRLQCWTYSLGQSIPELPRHVLRGALGAFTPNEFSSLADVLVHGPKRAHVQLGIGRFIHVVPPVGHKRLCLVGTDDGSLVTVALDEARQPAKVHSEPFAPARVWAVAGRWLDPNRLRVTAGTSDSVLERRDLSFDVSPPTVVSAVKKELRDWPREIRPVMSSGGLELSDLVVACENGDLVIEAENGSVVLPVATGETLRTAFAHLADDGTYTVLTGSDDASITQYRQGVKTWSHPARDRVREVLALDDEHLAVSEDRYLYVIDREGVPIRRYRFPHRALCVDVLADERRGRQYVVGCGDGSVYVIDASGFVQSAFEFPDRIRDVRVIDDRELLVACEDGNLYLAPTIDAFLTETYSSSRPLGAIDSRVQSLRSGGLLAGAELESDEAYALLSYVEHWFMAGADKERVLALIDEVGNQIATRATPRARYVYSSAVIFAAARIDAAAGKSRIETFLRDRARDPYALHSFVCLIPRVLRGTGAGHDPHMLVDTIINHVQLEDEWIEEELVRHLFDAGFFDCAASGFPQYFRNARTGYNKIARLVEAASKSLRPEIRSTPLVQLRQSLQRPSEYLSSAKDPQALLGGPDAPEFLADWLAQWHRVLRGEDQVTPISELFGQTFGRDSDDASIRDLLTDVLDLQRAETVTDGPSLQLLADVTAANAIRFDPEVSAREFLALEILIGLIRARGAFVGGRP